MTDHVPATKRRRTRLIIDKPAQLAMALTVTGMTAAGVVVLMASMYVLPMAEYFDHFSGQDMRRALLIILGTFFTITVIGITLSCVVLSHRFVGPAYVVRQALDAMAKGDYDARLSLRSNDYLQDLAESARGLRDALVERDEQLAAARARLAEGDVEAACKILEVEAQPELVNA